MSRFTSDEIGYLTGGDRRLARIATIGADGTPHVTPVGHSYNADLDTIDGGGRNLTATKKYRDLTTYPKVAIVVDDVPPPWKPRGVEIRGHAEAVAEPEAVIRIHPERIISWGLDTDDLHHRNARTVTDTKAAAGDEVART